MIAAELMNYYSSEVAGPGSNSKLTNNHPVSTAASRTCVVQADSGEEGPDCEDPTLDIGGTEDDPDDPDDDVDGDDDGECDRELPEVDDDLDDSLYPGL